MPFASTVSSLTYRKDSVRIPVPLSTNSSGRRDGFVYKYAPNGQVLWSARISCSGDGFSSQAPAPLGSATDSTGAVYVVGFGFFSSSGDQAIAINNLFYNADGSYAASVTLPVFDNRAPFCAKYSATGVYQWAVFVAPTVNTNRNSFGSAVVVDSSDNVYFSGAVGGGLTSGSVVAYNADGSASGTSFPYSGGPDTEAFLVKYNSAGTAQWLTRVAASSVDHGRGLAIDSTGLYMVGQVSGTNGTFARAYNANGTAFGTTLTLGSSIDVLVVKYDTNGNVSWLTRIASTAEDIGYAAVADNAGNFYVAGQGGSAVTTTAYNSDGTAFGTPLTSVGLTDSFLVKYSSTGTVQWVAKMGSTAADIGFAITRDSGGNVYVVGQQGSATFTAYNSDGSAFGTTIPARTSISAFLVKYNAAGYVEWLAQMGGSALAYAATSDTLDNIYVGVRANTSIVVYNSNGTTFATVGSLTSPAICLVRYNSSGTAQGVNSINSLSNPSALCSDLNNNIFLGGSFSAYITKNLGPSTTVAFTLPIAGSSDAFIVKYSANGAPWWAARIASTALDTIYAVATDSNRNIYVTGGVVALATVYNASGTAFSRTIPANTAFIVKYDWLGVVQWVATFTSAAGRGIEVDSAGNVYVTAIGVPVTNTLRAVNANGVVGVSQSTTGTAPAMLVKYDTNGTAQWIARIATTNTHTFLKVAVDSSDNVVAVGFASANGVAFNANGTSFATLVGGGVVIKYNSSGTVQWAARIAGGFMVSAVACDASNNVYAAGRGGSTTSGVTIYNANGTTFVTLPVTAGFRDGFVVKYDSAGAVQWATRFASTDDDFPHDLATDPAGNLYLAGASGDANSLGTTAVLFYNPNGTQSTRGVPKNLNVGYLVKYSPAGIVQWNAWAKLGTDDALYSVAIDRRGDIYAGGTTGVNGPVVHAGYSTGNAYITTAINAAKFTPYGLLQWHQTIKGATNRAITYGLATDPDCNLIVVGEGPFTEITNIYRKA